MLNQPPYERFPQGTISSDKNEKAIICDDPINRK